jgi:uncharacterized protein
MANQENHPDRGRGIEVTGQGSATGQPDLVRIRLAVTATRAGVAEALAVCDAAVRQLRTALAARGVSGPDAATAGLSVTAEQVWSEQTGPRVTGYRADQELLVTSHDVAGLGVLLAEALAAGGDDVRLSGVEFAMQDDAGLRAAARTAAWADALARAGQLAELAGRGLGPVLDLLEQSDGWIGGPIPKVRAMAMSAPAEVSVDPGRVAVDVSLAVRWALA